MLNEDLLDAERERFSKFCRDNAYFDFSKSYIYFEVDTTIASYEAAIKMKIIPRTVEDIEGNITELPHLSYKVSDVTYYVHRRDSNAFKNFDVYQQRLNDYGLSIVGNNYPLLDTLYYADTITSKRYVFFGPTKTFVYRGTFIYNESLPISPFLFDRQNFLEITNGGDNGWYREYYVERSYSRLLGLDIFSSITPSVSINEQEHRRVSITYDLAVSNNNCFRSNQTLQIRIVIWD